MRCTACSKSTPRSTFTDEFAEVAIDASQVIWIATANDERAIPEPILNRMNVYEVEAPDPEAARGIALRLYSASATATTGASASSREPCDAVLDQLAELAPREMRRAWMTAFGNARLDGRGSDRAARPARRRRQPARPIGFVQ